MDGHQPTTNGTKRVAIVLAGGEGSRLSDLTRGPDGVHVPKQFCTLLGETPLLEQARRRVSLSVPTERVCFVLNQDHERFFSPFLADVPQQNLIVQPGNRGTTPAILYSLLRVAEFAPRASVLLVASDHHVSDETALADYVHSAFEAVEENPSRTVLLGISPDEPETSYGWIEPEATPYTNRHLLPVRRFWEKPSHDIALELMGRGCLWNSFMIVGQLPTLLELFSLAMRELYVAFSKIRPSIGTTFEKEALRKLYQSLPESDFSREVLRSVAGNLSVLPVRDVGWSDLGEPDRLAKVAKKIRPSELRVVL